VGWRRSPADSPTAEVSSLRLTISTHDFESWSNWYRSEVVDGRIPPYEITGSVEFFDAGLEVVASLDLRGVRIVSLTMRGESSADFDVALSVQRIDLQREPGR
jgi:hypothetical protein